MGHSIKLLTDKEILALSKGEVTKHDTKHYLTLKPISSGLFCPKIFGHDENYKCVCGKYEGIEYKGIVCGRCGVTVDSKHVTRSRFGHISLAVPIALEHLVIPILKEAFGVSTNVLKSAFDGSIGLKLNPNTKGPKLLPTIDLQYSGNKGIYDLLKDRLTSQDLKDKMPHISEKFEYWGDLWYKNLLVLPAGLRPLIAKAKENKVISHPFNKLYANIISRNQKIKRHLIQSEYIYIPEFIIKSDIESLAKRVQQMFIKQTNTDANSDEKTIPEIIGSKSGLIRSHILGKRIDYSARSVITSSPNLKSWECAIPRSILLILFKPLIRKNLIEHGIYVYQNNHAEYMSIVKEYQHLVDSIILSFSKEYKILLNRNPTLFRYGIQALDFRISDSESISISPMICSVMGADFDGDELNMYLVFSGAAQNDIKNQMYRKGTYDAISGSLLLPFKCELKYVLQKFLRTDEQNFTPIKSISQVPNFIETLEEYNKTYYIEDRNIYIRPFTVEIFRYFRNVHGVDMEFEGDLTESKIYQINKDLHDKGYPVDEILNFIKDKAFYILELDGLSITIPEVEAVGSLENIEKSIKETDKLNEDIKMVESNQNVVKNKEFDNWYNCIETTQRDLLDKFNKIQGNNVIEIISSKARGSFKSLSVVLGMRGFTYDSKYDISSTVCTSNLFKGLSSYEAIMSASEGRKNFAAKTSRAAEDGYFTRKMIYSMYNILLHEEDCGSKKGIWLKGEEAESHMCLHTNEYITNPHPHKMYYVRSSIHCKSGNNKVCRVCFGKKAQKLPFGSYIGILSAQDISQPGTQLSIQTKKEQISTSNKLELKIMEFHPESKIIIPKDAIVKINKNEHLFIKSVIVKECFGDNKDDYLIHSVYCGSIIYDMGQKTQRIGVNLTLNKNLYAPVSGKITIKHSKNKYLISIGNKASLEYEDQLELLFENGDTVNKGDLVAIRNSAGGTDQLAAYDSLKKCLEGVHNQALVNRIGVFRHLPDMLEFKTDSILEEEISAVKSNAPLYYKDCMKKYSTPVYLSFLARHTYNIFRSAGIYISISSLELLISSLCLYQDDKGQLYSWDKYIESKEQGSNNIKPTMTSLLAKPSYMGWLYSSTFNKTFKQLLHAGLYNIPDNEPNEMKRLFFNREIKDENITTN